MGRHRRRCADQRPQPRRDRALAATSARSVRGSRTTSRRSSPTASWPPTPVAPGSSCRPSASPRRCGAEQRSPSSTCTTTRRWCPAPAPTSWEPPHDREPDHRSPAPHRRAAGDERHREAIPRRPRPWWGGAGCPRRRGALPARSERRGQVHVDQGALGELPARRGRDPLGGRAGRADDAAGGHEAGHLDHLPGARPRPRAERRGEHLPRPRAGVRRLHPAGATNKRAPRSCWRGSVTPRSPRRGRWAGSRPRPSRS